MCNILPDLVLHIFTFICSPLNNVISLNADLPTLDFLFEYHLCDGNGGRGHISYVVYIICSVRITLFMLNISQRSAPSHIQQLHDSG